MAAVNGRIRAARDFLEASSREFAAGDNRQGSEKLWGAAAQAVIAMSQERGWSYGNHGALKNATERLTAEYDDPSIRTGFLAAEKFHANFYHDFMEDFQLSIDRTVVHDFVEQMLTYHGGG